MVSIALSRGGIPSREQLPTSTHEGQADEPTPLELVVDDSTFEARLGKKSCFLGSSIEYRLLSYLHANRRRFVSVTELMDEVWEDDQTRLNTIQKTVCNLRRRLEQAGFSAAQIDGSQQGYYRLRVAR
jgi:DNA-binding response OmpR family regulator